MALSFILPALWGAVHLMGQLLLFPGILCRQQMVQVDRLELFAGQGLLEGRELQDRAEDGRHGPEEGDFGTVPGTDSAAQTDGLVDDGSSFFGGNT